MDSSSFALASTTAVVGPFVGAMVFGRAGALVLAAFVGVPLVGATVLRIGALVMGAIVGAAVFEV